MIEAGRLRHRASFEERGLSKSEIGASIETWSQLFTTRCEIKSGNTDSSIDDGAAFEVNDLTMIVRSTSSTKNVTPENHRVTIEGQQYTITMIDKFTSDRFIKLSLTNYV
jgi:SPP1 family predicted phage head-tail adaptor